MSSKSNQNKSKNAVKKNQNDSSSKVIAEQINVKFISGESKVIKEFSTSTLFKIYLKNQLENRQLTLPYKSDISFLSSKLTYEITDYTVSNQEENNKDESNKSNSNMFYINKTTDIIFDTSNIDIDILQNEFENLKISSDNQQITEENIKYLKEILNKKIAGFQQELDKDYKPNMNQKICILNHEDFYKKMLSLIEFNFNTSNNSEGEENKSALKNNENKSLYYYKTLLISGPSGSGKTNMLNYLKQNYLDVKKINYFDFDIFTQSPENKDEILDKIKNIFKFSKLLKPTVTIIENIDLIFPKKDSSSDSDSNEIELTNLLTYFINEIQNLPQKVFVIFTSKSNNKISPLIQSKIDFVINLPFPNFSERKNIILHYLSDFNNDLSQTDIDNLASKTHGFLPSDLIKLFKTSYFSSFYSNSPILTLKNLEENLSQLKPINLKEILLEIPKVKWEQIGGNKDTIKSIRQSIELPLKNPEIFKKIGIEPPKGILLFGPPGCSKTLIAKALATESGLNFLAVKGPELFSKYVGDSEKAVRDIFAKAKQCAPSIIFFDEIDSMASQRNSEGGSGSGVEDKVLCQLLNEMDGVEGRENVIVFAATNRPFALDKAIIRPGRFDRLIYIHPPCKEEREEIFQIYLKKMSISEEVDISELATLSDGFSGADIKKVCMEAAMLAINENVEIDKIDKKFFLAAIKNTKSVITQEMLNEFESFLKKSLFQ